MTPYKASIVDQERCEVQDAIAFERRIEGTTDAAFGYLPQYADDDYLLGYVEGIKALRHDRNGKILYYTAEAKEPDIKEFSVPIPENPDPNRKS